MKLLDGTIHLSATDLANHLACRHLTALNRAVEEKRIARPPQRADLILLRELGERHERAYLTHLGAQGLRLSQPPEGERESESAAAERTLGAMKTGVDVIVQAALRSGRWLGRADVLRRVSAPSKLGAWSYEVYDTKLALETRGGSVLQLCLYSDLLAGIQGVVPEFMYIVPPRPEFPAESYRVADFAAYYRRVRQRAEEAVDSPTAAPTYPEPVAHCDICNWWKSCDDRRHADDHLSLVASISKQQTRELESRGIATLAALAGEPIPLQWRPKRGAKESYARAREQARVQLEGRTENRPVHEWLQVEDGRGLTLLPEPSQGDVFLDLEGDPFAGEGGLEYLFGWATRGASGEAEYRCTWALDRVSERAAFEAWVDEVLALWERHPGLHIYHYASYEPGALKRLMGRYATRESEIDRMLRGGLFVDLHIVARQALRASVEEYSIKKLEPVFGYERQQPLPEAGTHLRMVQRALELGSAESISEESRQVVEAYNRDDCVSALALRDWLERERARLVEEGVSIPRPKPREADPKEDAKERQLRTRRLMEVLLTGIPEDPVERTAEQEALHKLAYLLDFHRREQKAPWWEYFDLQTRTDEELFDESVGLAGLEFVERVGGTDRAPVHRYRFPKQETKIRARHKLHTPLPDCREVGKVEQIDLVERHVDVKKTMECAALHPTAVFSHKMYSAPEQADSLMRLGAWVADHGLGSPGPFRASRDLLLRLPPRLAGHVTGNLARQDESGGDAACRLLPTLDHSVLGIQGPPGSGKTWNGARMILDSVSIGRKVGICAVSHEVIRNLLKKVVELAQKEGIPARCAHKPEVFSDDPGLIAEPKTNKDAERLLMTGSANVLGGTAWLWSRQEFLETIDVLFVDEAGQMSLADVLAIGQAAKTIILLGDPRQLDRPIQGSHPEGTAVSALEHLLHGEPTIPRDRGIFLEETWRLHPAICEITSELFYASRLHARTGLELQAILGSPAFDGSGIWFLPVEHDGCKGSSQEEVEIVRSLVKKLTSAGVLWRDMQGWEHSIALDDILIVAPYNAQVADLTVALPGARIGTVDKFQGQEAPIVIYSMTTSSPEDVPRGMEFFYSSNRINVATSRARCACILVGNPRLFGPDCQTPRQMLLANAFCRFREAAREVGSKGGIGGGSKESKQPKADAPVAKGSQLDLL